MPIGPDYSLQKLILSRPCNYNRSIFQRANCWNSSTSFWTTTELSPPITVRPGECGLTYQRCPAAKAECSPPGGFTWIWWSRGGSNSRPSHCERADLPAELRPHAEWIVYTQLGSAFQIATGSTIESAKPGQYCRSIRFAGGGYRRFVWPDRNKALPPTTAGVGGDGNHAGLPEPRFYPGPGAGHGL